MNGSFDGIPHHENHPTHVNTSGAPLNSIPTNSTSIHFPNSPVKPLTHFNWNPVILTAIPSGLFILMALQSELLFLFLFGVYNMMNLLCLVNEGILTSVIRYPRKYGLSPFSQRRLSVFLPFVISLIIIFPTVTGLFTLSEKFWILFRGADSTETISFHLFSIIVVLIASIIYLHFLNEPKFPSSHESHTLACLFIESVPIMNQTSFALQPLPTSSFLSSWWSQILGGVDISAIFSAIMLNIVLFPKANTNRTMLPTTTSSIETGKPSISTKVSESMIITTFVVVNLFIIMFLVSVTPSTSSQLFIFTFLDITSSMIMILFLVWRIMPPFFIFGSVMMQSTSASQVFGIEQDLEKIRLFHPQITSFQNLTVWSLDTSKLIMSIQINVKTAEEMVRSSILSSVHRVLGPRIYFLTAEIIPPASDFQQNSLDNSHSFGPDGEETHELTKTRRQILDGSTPKDTH